MEYSNRVPGAQLNETPAASSSSNAVIGSPCCRSPHGSSVGNPAVIVSSCLIVTGAASADPYVQPASSGTYCAAGSSSASAPASRSSRMADAVNDLDIDAILNTVSASGGPAPRTRAPNPALCTSSPPATMP